MQLLGVLIHSKSEALKDSLLMAPRKLSIDRVEKRIASDESWQVQVMSRASLCEPRGGGVSGECQLFQKGQLDPATMPEGRVMLAPSRSLAP